jgi:hypothetical protein
MGEYNGCRSTPQYHDCTSSNHCATMLPRWSTKSLAAHIFWHFRWITSHTWMNTWYFSLLNTPPQEWTHVLDALLVKKYFQHHLPFWAIIYLNQRGNTKFCHLWWSRSELLSVALMILTQSHHIVPASTFLVDVLTHTIYLWILPEDDIATTNQYYDYCLPLNTTHNVLHPSHTVTALWCCRPCCVDCLLKIHDYPWTCEATTTPWILKNVSLP